MALTENDANIIYQSLEELTFGAQLTNSQLERVSQKAISLELKIIEIENIVKEIINTGRGLATDKQTNEVENETVNNCNCFKRCFNKFWKSK